MGMARKKTAKKRMGRPPKPPSEKFSEMLNVKMTKAERKMLESEAKRLGISLAAVLMRPWRKEE